MTEATQAAQPERNRVNMTKKDYEGAPSTLCRGCGHDAITASIMTACYENNVDPAKVIKMSGIGCSAKTPTYFMSQSFGFNGLHGRMAAMATGVNMANRNMLIIGPTGDGDTASIGLGHFAHMMRRHLRIAYIVENNGVYGLTKGQFSATADVGSKLKKGPANVFTAVDIPSLAILMGATFVARSFSGDRKQLTPLIRAALNHRGTAILDVLSPCVTFNDHDGSTKSLKYIRNNRDAANEIEFIEEQVPNTDHHKEGTDLEIEMHGGTITLHKIKDHDPRDRMAAMQRLDEAQGQHKFLTGLLYINEDRPDLAEIENLSDTPLAYLPIADLRPPKDALDKINASLML
jgi:2-oxoglutarate/2-oxoacid ferredoxin oxidoreductase subunit beta